MYAVGLVLVRARPPAWTTAAVVACAIQLIPLGAPLLLSTDAWSYWNYGRLAAVHGASPYEVEPRAYPHDPSFPHIGTDWRDQTTVYGPAFTLASEPLARLAGASSDAAAWLYKTLAALAMLGAAYLAARLSPRPALAWAFVGWNPLLAVHLGGAGHNDAWIGLLVVAALAAAASGKRWLAGVCWALAALVKWVTLLLLPLRALEARATGRRVDHLGFAATVGVVGVLATWRYGWSWLGAFSSLARNANRETQFAFPHRFEQLGVPQTAVTIAFALGFAVVYLLLLREAARGRARLALAMVAALVATPYITPWYLAWAVPLAAAEDDEWAGLATVVLGAYLLRQTIPL